MELFGLELPLWPALLFASFVALYYYSKRNHDYFDKMMVPYPKPWPFFGNLFEFFGPADEVFAGYVKKYGKVFGLLLGSSPSINVADAEFVKEVTVKQFSKFCDRRSGDTSENFKRSLTNLSADHWKHVRNQLSGAFTSGKLKQMLTLIDQNVDDLTQHLAAKAGEEIVVKDFTGAYTLDAIASTAFGLLIDSQKNPDAPVLKHAKTFFSLSIKNPLIFIMFMFPALGKLLLKMGFSLFPKESSEYFAEIIRQKCETHQRGAETNKDFISIVLDRKIDMADVSPESIKETKGEKWSTEGLSDNEIMGNAIIFFLAGYETTATLLQYSLFALANHPDIAERVRAEVVQHTSGKERPATYEELGKMDYLEWVMCETLRKYPPAMVTDRLCIEEATVKGIRIPKGCTVTILIYNIHHDPEYWPEPETFNPERFDPTNKPDNLQYIYLPFGVGPRNCIGMRLALLEAKAALARIVHKFDIERTPATLSEPLTLKTGSGFMVTKDPIKLKLTPRALCG